ncbi:hypothetical protein BH11VER1_BH11VER1_07930 [soil metagenome]
MTDEDFTTILKRDAMGRVTITREQRDALLDECSELITWAIH